MCAQIRVDTLVRPYTDYATYFVMNVRSFSLACPESGGLYGQSGSNCCIINKMERLVEININKTNNWTVVAVLGRLDTTSAPEFDGKIQEVLARGENQLILDLSRLEYVSSAGLRSVIAAAKSAASRGGRLSCCGLSGVVKKVFDVSGFTTLLPVFETLNDALAR